MIRKKKVSLRYACDSFFHKLEGGAWAVSFSEVSLKTGHSKVLPKDINLATHFSKNVTMNMPIVSSPMDTVTEAEMAIAMAKYGGLGIIHRNLTPENQAKALERVKHELSAFVPDPICIRASQTVKEVLEMAKQKGYKFLSFPVLNGSGRVIGIVARSNFEFCMNTNKKIADIMTKDVIGAPDGTKVEKAYRMMMQNRIKILPINNRQGDLMGIYTLADVKRIVMGNSVQYNLAANGTLRVGAAIGVGDDGRDRMALLASANADVVVIDTAHGDTDDVIEMLKYCKRTYPGIDIVVGNVSQGESAKRLAKAGADGVRTGQGSGSICSTTPVTGTGCPQLSAIYYCAKALRGSGVSIIGDGGIKYSGDITKALAAGAHTVMIGNLLAGTREAPGEVVIFGPNNERVKAYRGMGSLGAMNENQGSRTRYKQVEGQLTPEGVEGYVGFQGDVPVVLQLLIGGVRAGMGACGTPTILDLQMRGDFNRIGEAGLRESRPHDLDYIKKAPNYGG